MSLDPSATRPATLDPGGPEISGAAFLGSVLGFGRELKAEGLTADLAAVLDFCRALTLVDIGDREEVRAAGEALFVRRREEIDPYEVAFDRFWRRRARPVPPELEIVDDRAPQSGEQRAAGRGRPWRRRPGSPRRPATARASEEGDEIAPSILAYSAGERIRTKAFERMTAAGAARRRACHRPDDRAAADAPHPALEAPQERPARGAAPDDAPQPGHRRRPADLALAAPPDGAPLDSCCCATSAAPWSATRDCCCASGTRWRARRCAPSRSCSARA